MQGFLFFGNGRRVVEFVRAWLDGAHDNAHYAILDLAHATGADASAVDALLEAARLVQATHRREAPALYVCGAHEDVRRALRRRQASGGAAVKQSLDVDSALGDCEARLLRDLREGNSQTPLRRLGGDGPAVVSFERALVTAVRRSALSGFAADAEIDALLAGPGLSECAEARRLKSGEALLPHGAAGEPTGHDDALYIVASGRMNVRRDPNQSTGAILRKARRHATSISVLQYFSGKYGSLEVNHAGHFASLSSEQGVSLGRTSSCGGRGASASSWPRSRACCTSCPSPRSTRSPGATRPRTARSGGSSRGTSAARPSGRSGGSEAW